MFCKYCGSEIEDNKKNCSNCGKQVKGISKRCKWFIYGGVIITLIIVIIFTFLVMLLKIIPNLMIGGKKVESSSGIQFDNETYEYGDYVKLQEGTNVLNIRQFLPRDGSYTYDNYIKKDKPYITSESIFTNNVEGITFKEYNEVVADYSYGRYDMTDSTEKARMIKIYDSNILGKSSTKVYMVPMDSIYQIGQDPEQFIGSPAKMFTVTVKAGKFTDCVCMVKNTENGSVNGVEISYYAPHVGLILTLSKDESVNGLFGKEWAVTKELANMSTYEESSDTEGENVEENGGNTGRVNTELSKDLELSNNLILELPDNWVGNYYLFEGNTYYTFCEKQNHDNGYDGTLFYINQCYSSEELEYLPESKVLGVYDDNGVPTALVIAYPSDVAYNNSDEEFRSAYEKLSDTIDRIQFNTNELSRFKECNRDNLDDYLKN